MVLRRASWMSRALPFALAAAFSCGDDEPGSAARPERFVYSDDGRAMLWLPEGAAPSDAAITVTREPSEGDEELRYLLEPSGLAFARPAALFVALDASALDEAVLPIAELASANGDVEGTPSFVWSADLLGYQDRWAILPITHFSGAAVKPGRKRVLPEYPGGIAYASAVAVHVPFQSPRLVGTQWSVPVHIAPGADLIASYITTASASGAVRLRERVRSERAFFPTEPPEPGEQPPEGSVHQGYAVELPLECRAPGQGKIEVRVVVTGDGFEQIDGWIQRTVQCVEAAAVSPPPEPVAHLGEAIGSSTTEDAMDAKSAVTDGLEDAAEAGLCAAAERFQRRIGPPSSRLVKVDVSAPCVQCPVGEVFAGAASVLSSLRDPEQSGPFDDRERPSYFGVRVETSRPPGDPIVVVETATAAPGHQVVIPLDARPAVDELRLLSFDLRCLRAGDDFLVATYYEGLEPRFQHDYRSTVIPIRCVAPTEPACSPTDPTMADVRAVAQLLDFAVSCLPVEVTNVLHSAVAVGLKLVANDHTTLRRFGGGLLGVSNMSAGASSPLGSITQADFDPADFPCGAGPNGYTLCVDPGLPAPEGPFTVLYTALAGSVPIADPVNHYQYGFVFDSDGVAANNYQPLPQYANDYFKGTDRWYAAEYTPAQGWRLRVTDASGGGLVIVPSDARLVLAGNSMVLLVPTSELVLPTPPFRLSAFRHTGDYGVNPPHDWDGSVWPAVADGLASFPE